jgi:hypothetical protein
MLKIQNTQLLNIKNRLLQAKVIRIMNILQF